MRMVMRQLDLLGAIRRARRIELLGASPRLCNVRSHRHDLAAAIAWLGKMFVAFAADRRKKTKSASGRSR
jgi:hypothetical protein